MEPQLFVYWLLTICCILQITIQPFDQVFAAKTECNGDTTPLQFPHITSDIEEILGKSYDYIIVGGGTTACPLAATLSQKFSVLVLERGGSPYQNPSLLQRKSFGIPLLQTDEFHSVAQKFVSLDGVTNFRGRVLGGSTAINAGFYSRASGDFVRKSGWDEKMVEEAYEWVESKVVFQPIVSPWQLIAMYGFMEVGVLPYNGYRLDHTEGTKVSGTLFDVSGRRHTAADLLAAGNLENITVLLNVTVEKIIFDKDGNKPRARGVKFMKSDGNPEETYKVYLKKAEDSSSWGEVILSSGALGSPQILMLSGIGPRKDLQELNIPLLANSEAVGKKMKDNPAIALVVDSMPRPIQPDPPQVTAITQSYQIIMESAVIPISLNLTRTNIAAKVAYPKSEGKLELNSTDPRHSPVVKFNYLMEDEDMELCVQMRRLVEKVASSASVAMYLGSQKKEYMKLGEDERKKFCKKNVTTIYHFHGGCCVGSVVDKEYKVYGVDGLRVLDGSTLLESPGTNPSATLMMLGRYQGIKILQERTGS